MTRYIFFDGGKAVRFHFKDIWNEMLHPRRLNGRFTTGEDYRGGGGGGYYSEQESKQKAATSEQSSAPNLSIAKSPEEQKIPDQEVVKAVVEKSVEKLKKARWMADIKDALTDAFVSIQGNYPYSDPKYGDVTVNVGENLKKELFKYFYDKNGNARPFDECIDIANRQLVGFQHLYDLLKNGRKTKWGPSSSGHVGKEYSTVYKRFMYKGKNKVFYADIERDMNSSRFDVHNTSAWGNPGSEEKAKHLGVKWEDGSRAVYRLVSIRWA